MASSISVAGAVSFLLGLCLALPQAEAAPAAARLLCHNTTSGAAWTIAVDYHSSTVDGIPARITSDVISWEDADGHYYDLHRDTGALEMHVASSMGGFYLTDECAVK